MEQTAINRMIEQKNSSRIDAGDSIPADVGAILTPEEAKAIADAIQWAGHFATLAGDCQPNGPAFSTIAAATRAIEAQGFPVYHGRAARDAIEADEVDEDDGCPVGDPGCDGRADACHWACEAPAAA